MRYVICASLPLNHAYNDRWMLERKLRELGFTDIKISVSEPVRQDKPNIDDENPPTCKMHKIVDRWVPD